MLPPRTPRMSFTTDTDSDDFESTFDYDIERFPLHFYADPMDIQELLDEYCYDPNERNFQNFTALDMHLQHLEHAESIPETEAYQEICSYIKNKGGKCSTENFLSMGKTGKLYAIQYGYDIYEQNALFKACITYDSFSVSFILERGYYTNLNKCSQFFGIPVKNLVKTVHHNHTITYLFKKNVMQLLEYCRYPIIL